MTTGATDIVSATGRAYDGLIAHCTDEHARLIGLAGAEELLRR